MRGETAHGKVDFEILPCFFRAGGMSGVELVKPTFGQKLEIARLRNRSFGVAADKEFNTGWRRFIDLVARDLGFDDLTADSPFIIHPRFWNAVGWVCENPTEAFQKYNEPYEDGGKGKVCNFEDYERGYKIQGNGFMDMPLSPLSSRYSGGLLTQDCMLFFLESQPFLSKELIKKREQPEIPRDGHVFHYHYPFIAMEITRKLALVFDIISTRVQETPKYPIQPDTRVMIPFDVDYRDKRKVIPYIMGSHWVFLSEKDCFKRLHVVCTLVYDVIYSQKEATVADTFVILEDMNAFIKDALSRTRTVKELEEILLIVLGDIYRQNYDLKCMAIQEMYNRDVNERQILADIEAAEKEVTRIAEWLKRREIENEENELLYMNLEDHEKHRPEKVVEEAEADEKADEKTNDNDEQQQDYKSQHKSCSIDFKTDSKEETKTEREYK